MTISTTTFSFGLSTLALAIPLACSSGSTGNPGTGGTTCVEAEPSCAASGGAASGGGGTATGTGGAASGGATTATGGATLGSGGSTSNPGTGDLTRCEAAGLVWKSGKKTHYESYPDPNSIECLPPEQGGYNGCMWSGYFSACSGQQTEEWVASHNIAAVFPLDGLRRHDLCLRSGDKRMIVTALDTCGDDDCNGCCTANKGTADALIDLEKATNERWGLVDGMLEWADLGENADPGCADY